MRFGVFESILRSGMYTSLLDGAGPDVLDEVRRAVQRTSDLSEAVRLMLDDRNWRTDLVAVAAVLLADSPSELGEPLWEAFDYGSWVAPQLAVSLYLVDPGFRRGAKDRIAARCLPGTAIKVRPGPWDQIAARNLASLLQVLWRVDDERDWVDAQRRAPDVRDILRQDVDSAGAIADRWFESMSRALVEVGHPPRPNNG